MRLLLALVLVLVAPTVGAATALGDAAAALAVKDWVDVTSQFSVSGFASLNALIRVQGGNSHIFEFANSGAWDPVNRAVRFCGASHGLTYDARCITLQDSTNTWSEFTWVAGECQGGHPTPCFNHAYDHNTTNPSTGDFYYVRGEAAARIIKRFRAGSWQILSSVPAFSFPAQPGKILKWHEALNAIVLIDADSGVWKGVMRSGTSVTWTCLAKVASSATNCPGGALNGMPPSSSTMVGEYSQVHRALCFGLGTAVHCLRENGRVATMPAAPRSVSLLASVWTVDPVSGNFLVYGNSGPMYELNPSGSGAWTQVTGATVPSDLTDRDNDGHMVVPISTYGVVMHVRTLPGSAKVYLYKHTATTALTPLRVSRYTGAP